MQGEKEEEKIRHNQAWIQSTKRTDIIWHSSKGFCLSSEAKQSSFAGECAESSFRSLLLKCINQDLRQTPDQWLCSDTQWKYNFCYTRVNKEVSTMKLLCGILLIRLQTTKQMRICQSQIHLVVCSMNSRNLILQTWYKQTQLTFVVGL